MELPDAAYKDIMKRTQCAEYQLSSWINGAVELGSRGSFFEKYGDLQDAPGSELWELRVQDSLVEAVDLAIRGSSLNLNSYSETLFTSVTFVTLLNKLYLSVLEQINSNTLPLQARDVGQLLIQRHAKLANVSEEAASTPYIENLRWRNYVRRFEKNVFGESYNIPVKSGWKYKFTRFPVEALHPFPYDLIIDSIVSCTAELVEIGMSLFREREDRLASARRSLSEWQNLHPHPGSQPYGVSHRGAEEWVRDWCIHMGMEQASLTPATGDDGIDIESPAHIVQVKNYQGSVPIREIREMLGVAASDGRQPFFFTSGAYPVSAEPLASKGNLVLFRYNVTLGKVSAVNDLARDLLKGGGFLTRNAGKQKG